MTTDRVPGKASESSEVLDWWAKAAALSDDPAYLANLWLGRHEETVVFGSKWYDADLNPLDCASDDAALEVRLVRHREQAVCRAKFEIRTTLALHSGGSSQAKINELIDDAQRDLADRAGLSFAEPGAAKPHVFTSGPRGLLRAYGKNNVFDLQEAAQPLLRAYWFLASIWRAALMDGAVTIARVRRIAEDTIAPEHQDLRYLFAGRGENASVVAGRPELTDDLLARVGTALGCRVEPDGRYAPPAEEIVVAAETPPGSVVRMVAEDLAAARGVAVDTVLRKQLQPMLAGELNGPIVHIRPRRRGG